LAAKIDQYVSARLETANVKAAPMADDAEFLRRIYLDLVGRIPTVAEARAFLEDPAPDKRAKLIDRLVRSSAFDSNFTNFWRALMLPDSGGNIQFRFQVPDFEAWLRKRIRENVPYDAMVRELLTTSSGSGVNPRAIANSPRAEPTP